MSDNETIFEDEAPQEDNPLIEKQANGQIKVTLIHPIRADIKPRNSKETEERLYEDVLIRPVSMGDLKALGNEDFKNDTQQAYFLLARLHQIPKVAFDKIYGEDMNNCIEAIQDFLPKSRKT